METLEDKKYKVFKSSLVELNKRTETTEEKDRELEDESTETIQSEEQKEKDFKK